MNYVDNKFYLLVEVLKNLKEEEIFVKIKSRYLRLDKKIQNSLEDYFQKFPYWGNLNSREDNFEEIKGRAAVLKEHLSDFVWLYDTLKDYRSKKLLYAILNNWYQYDFKTLGECQERTFCDYFDLDLVKVDKNTVLVDLGAYTGDTTLNFINSYQGIYKKIYCYDITDESLIELKRKLSTYQGIEIRKKAVSDREEKLFLMPSIVDNSANRVTGSGEKVVEAVSIDEDVSDNVSIIKMDIEGYEQKALKGCRRHIVKEHPTLLLSVYHNYEDLYKIPQMIRELSADYQFYLRYHGGAIFPTEITLIAIYKNDK